MSADIADLVLQARSQDPATRHCAFEDLVRRFQNMALGYALGILGDYQEAEDVSQDAFLSAYKDLGKLEDPRAFPGWFKRMVLYKARRLQRSDRRTRFENLDSRPAQVPASEPNPADRLAQAQERARIYRAIESLPEHERLVTALFYLAGYSNQKIAAFLALPAPTVRKRLQRARNRLKERMLHMAEDTFASHRPADDDRFARQTVDMIRAAEAGDLSKIAVLLSRNPSLLDADAPLADSYPVQAAGWRPLHIAAWHGRAHTVEFLLEQGADINARCHGNRTPLHYAVEAGNEETRRLLIDKGAQIDMALAAILGMEGRVKRMLAEDPTLADDRSTGGPPLEWAVWGGHSAIARLLLDSGAEANDPVVSSAAVSSGRADLLRLLLDRGLDARLDRDGRTLLHQAVEMHFVEDNLTIVELLLEHGTAPNALAPDGRTALDIALEKGGQGKFTLNPHETPNEQRQYSRIAALLQERGGKRSRDL